MTTGLPRSLSPLTNFQSYGFVFPAFFELVIVVGGKFQSVAFAQDSTKCFEQNPALSSNIFMLWNLGPEKCVRSKQRL